LARRNQNSGDSRYYYDWLDHAGEDMIGARLLLEDDRCYNLAAFHCQQAIEKALKSYILLKSGRPVDGHNLTWLCKQARRYDNRFAEWLDESAALNRCYIETRYPADVARTLHYAQVRHFCDIAQEMFLFICTQMDEYFKKNQNPAPIRESNR